MTQNNKMKKFDIHVAGKTLRAHERIVEKLCKRGAQTVQSPEQSDVTIVFCPLSSRYEADVTSALSDISGDRSVILVLMHHTSDPNHTIIPTKVDKDSVILVVDFLFYEDIGLLHCKQNRAAVKTITEKMGLSKGKVGLMCSTDRITQSDEEEEGKKKKNKDQLKQAVNL